MRASKTVVVRNGDRARIACCGVCKEGVVLRANNYGNVDYGGKHPVVVEDDWYICMLCDDDDVVYWKQGVDGGSVEILERAEK